MGGNDISYTERRSSVQYDPLPLDTKEPLSRASTEVPMIVTQRRRWLSLRLLAPTVVVFLGTAGLAILVIAWLVTHKTQSSLSQTYHEGAFLLDEGTRQEGGREAGRLALLTITSAASTVIGLFTPIFMALYAYRTASAWMDAKENKLPTPLQYGLLLDALSGAGVVPLMNISVYLFKARNGRSVPPMLIEAFTVSMIAYLLVHSVSAVDLWLHSVTSSVLDTTERPMSPSNYTFTGRCLPFSPDGGACQWSAGGWLGNRTQAMLINANKTDEFRAITLVDDGGIGVIVDPTVPQDIAFQASSYGARATCESLNLHCGLAPGHDGGNITCPGFPPNFPLSEDSGLADVLTNDFNAASSSMYLLSSTCVDCRHLAPSNVTIGTVRSQPNTTISTYNMWFQIAWTSAGQASHYKLPGANNTALSAYFNNVLLLANCSLNFYNVTLGYRNGSYSLLDEALTPPGMTDGMSSALRLGVFASNLLADIEGPVFSLPTTDDAMAAFSRSLARFAAGSAVGTLSTTRQPARAQFFLAPRILGRYPFAPVATILVLLFLYAVFALGVCAATALSRGDTLDGGTSVLDLVALRLSSHVAIAAELFPPTMERAERSVRTDASEMHDEADHAPVCIGVHREAGGPVFRLWRKRSHSPEEDDSKY